MAKKKSNKSGSKGRQQNNTEAIAEAPVQDAPPIVPTIEETLGQKPKHQIPWRKICIVAAACLGAVLIIWVICGLLFGRVSIAGQKLSARTPDASLQKTIASKAASYRLTLVTPEGAKTVYSMTDMGITPDASATVKQIRKEQNSLAQRLLWWRPVKAKLKTNINSSALNDFIAKKAQIITAPAQNAVLTIADGKTITTPPADGRQIGLDNAYSTLVKSASSLQSGSYTLKPTILKPTVSTESLKPVKDQVESILGQHIVIKIGGENVTVPANDIGLWISITPTDTGASIGVDEGKISDYLNYLAASRNSEPQNQVVSDTTGAVLTPGSKGKTIGGIEDATQAIKNELMKANGIETSLSVSYTNYKTISAPTANKWIEVDLSAKRLYAYNDGTLVNTILISAGAPGTPTPTGRFHIYAKYRSQDMTGPNLDGTTYYQPAVPYVNYFTGAYAIHGNYWRPSSYFGNIHSSHGCVGVPVDDGAWVYNWAPIGTPVVVHW